MCRAVNCRVCGKQTWAGCGEHVDEVMRGAPPAQRCMGHESRLRPWTRIFGRR